MSAEPWKQQIEMALFILMTVGLGFMCGRWAYQDRTRYQFWSHESIATIFRGDSWTGEVARWDGNSWIFVAPAVERPSH